MKHNFTIDRSTTVMQFMMQHVSQLTRNQIDRLIKAKEVRLNGKVISSNVNVSSGDQLAVYVPMSMMPSNAITEIYKDDNILVVDKDSGITSEDLLQNVLRKYPQAQALHRLDRNTEGVIVYALTKSAYAHLLNAFKSGQVQKIYYAVVSGVVPEHMLESAYLLKDSEQSHVTISKRPVERAVKISTEVFLHSTNNELSVVKVYLHTGKTHQIRAHLAYLGYPILGDNKYGSSNRNKKYNLTRQMLIAHSIKFVGISKEFDNISGVEFTTQKCHTMSKIGLISNKFV